MEYTKRVTWYVKEDRVKPRPVEYTPGEFYNSFWQAWENPPTIESLEGTALYESITTGQQVTKHEQPTTGPFGALGIVSVCVVPVGNDTYEAFYAVKGDE